VVVDHIQGEFEAQEDKMIKYLDQVHKCQSYFGRVVLTKIPRKANVRVDALSRLGSETEKDIEASTQEVIILTEPSLAPKPDVMQVDEAPTDPKWATDASNT
jgi:hypothetical protein